MFFLRPFILIVLFASFGLSHSFGKDDVLVPEVLHGFAIGLPGFETAPVPGGDGNFYGVTRRGGKGEGAFYQVTPAGAVTVLAEFGDPLSEARGRRPNGPLVYAGNGKFYGVTDEGGRFEAGTVFRVSQTGVMETLVDFSDEDDSAAPGEHPAAGLTLAPDGNFYGATRSGGLGGSGTIFRVSPQGRFESLANFTGAKGALPGENPNSQLLLLPDGTLAGLCYAGGRFGKGTIFVVDTSGHSLRSISIGPTAGPDVLQANDIVFGLVCTADGTIYGLLYDANFVGQVWQLPPTSAPSYFVDLDNDSNNDPISGLDPGIGLTSDGKLLIALNYDNGGTGGLYTVTPGVGTIARLGSFPAFPGRAFYDFGAASIVSDGAGGYLGSHFGILYRSDGTGGITTLASPNADGGSGLGVVPAAPVVFSPVGAPDAGTLYGCCREGGANDSGTIFKLLSGGSVSLLAALPQRNQLGYNNLNLEITPDGAGNLFFPGQGVNNAGAILKADGSGIISEVASFDYSTPPNNFAQDPYGRLTSDGLGGFYGLAQPVGSIFGNPTLAATVFHLTSGNTLLRVADVPRPTGGRPNLQPDGHLTSDSFGNLFGTFGSYNDYSDGFIYRVTPGGAYSRFADFYSPANHTGTRKPIGPLLREGATNNFIFPATGENGADQLLRVTAAGALQKLFFFDPAIDDEDFYDRNYPAAPLVQTNDGTSYGLMAGGGAGSVGFLYRFTADGKYTTLFSFKTGAAADNAGYPGDPGQRGDQNTPGLTLGPDGYIYGVCGQGGPLGGGTLFRFATAPQGAGSTLAATDLAAHSATLHASLTSNGYAGQYWFTGGIDGEPESSDPNDRTDFAAFNGTQSFAITPTDLKGHRNYHFQFHALVGVGADALAIDGATLTFTTQNGAPQAQNDAILVTAASGDFRGDVLANDTDLDGDTLTIQSIDTPPSHGTVQIDADGKGLVYHPGAGFFDAKQDSFTYLVTDNYAGGALTATATVNVLLDSTVVGDYAGLLFDEPAATGIPAEAAAIPSPDQIAAGLARFALSRNRGFTARFDIGGRAVAVKGVLAATRDTSLRGDRDRLVGDFRPLPAGTEGRITYHGRTLILRAGQGYSAAGAPLQPPSDYTMRFDPDQAQDPVAGAGLPAGSGYAIVRRGKKDGASVLGLLPDGTSFSKASVIGVGNTLPVFAPLYRDKSGSLNAQLVLATTAAGEIDDAPGTTTHWQKMSHDHDKRFAHGFAMTLTPFGGKYKVPARGQPPLTVPAGGTLTATFDRGSLFAPLTTPFTFTGAKPIAGPFVDGGARATLKFDPRDGLLSGTFRDRAKLLKYRGVVVQRDNTCAGFFLGTGDTGSLGLKF